MSRAQVIGDAIEFDGYRIATLTHVVPATVRQEFIDFLENARTREDVDNRVEEAVGEERLRLREFVAPALEKLKDLEKEIA